MKKLYRGYAITVKRDQSLAGWENIYCTVMRLRDDWFYIDDFHSGDYGTVPEVINEMKAHVDLLLDYPEEVEEERLPPELRAEREQEWWDEKGPTNEPAEGSH